jgi:hypothetical protein
MACDISERNINEETVGESIWKASVILVHQLMSNRMIALNH